MISEYVDRIPVPIPATLAAGSRNTRTANETNGEARYRSWWQRTTGGAELIYCRESFEFVVLEAFDGEEGYKTAVQHIPDLIVTDVMMPVKDGYDLCRRIRNNEKAAHIP
ncbi:MAG: response regulator [Bacteroidales bacterium]